MLINQHQNGSAYQASIRSRMKQLLRLMLFSAATEEPTASNSEEKEEEEQE